MKIFFAFTILAVLAVLSVAEEAAPVAEPAEASETAVDTSSGSDKWNEAAQKMLKMVQEGYQREKAMHQALTKDMNPIVKKALEFVANKNQLYKLNQFVGDLFTKDNEMLKYIQDPNKIAPQALIDMVKNVFNQNKE